MPVYQIFYLKDSEIERFRQMTPKEERRELMLRHYEEVGQIEAGSAYASWRELQEAAAEQRGIRKMGVGDVLAAPGERPMLCHFWGFEEAEWRSPAENRPGVAPNAQTEENLVPAGTDKA
jgi:hypothetical protein